MRRLRPARFLVAVDPRPSPGGSGSSCGGLSICFCTDNCRFCCPDRTWRHHRTSRGRRRPGESSEIRGATRIGHSGRKANRKSGNQHGCHNYFRMPCSCRAGSWPAGTAENRHCHRPDSRADCRPGTRPDCNTEKKPDCRLGGSDSSEHSISRSFTSGDAA